MTVLGFFNRIYFVLKDVMYSDTRGGARNILILSFEINGITSMLSRCTLQCHMPQTGFQNEKCPKALKKKKKAILHRMAT